MQPYRRLTLTTLLATALAGCVGLPKPAPAIAIGSVQGGGAHSPLLGREVVVEGSITADFRAGLGVMSLEGDADGDPATSDALFLVGAPDALQMDDRVRVRGTVIERDTGRGGSITALEVAEVRQLPAAPLPAAQVLQSLPRSDAEWEALEAMRVSMSPQLTLVASHNAARFGEWQVALEGPAWTPTEIALPGQAANRLAAANDARMLLLDDGDARENSGGVMSRDIPRTGSVLPGVSGIVDERLGRYRLQLAAVPVVAAASRPAAPPRMGEVRIAAMNLENLFNGDGRGGGFPTARGAKTQAAYLQQRAKLVMALAALDADVVALMELENDEAGAASSEAQLIDALNAVQGGDWRAVPMPANASTDAIRVGIIYRASKVRAVGVAATLDIGPFRDMSRPPLLQGFRVGDGPLFHVVANHFKSKGCRDAKGADADMKDGQSCWNATRLESAKLLDGWLHREVGANASVIVLGDLNAYAMEDPPRWLREAGWRDAFSEAGIAQPYSYVYDGQRGRLDHALLSPALAPRLQGAAEWHINADEPDVAEPAGAQVTPYRSSDHDPLVIDLRLRTR